MSNTSIWPIDRTLSSATTQDQSGPESNGNEGVLHIPQNFTDKSLAIRWFNFISRALVGGVLPLCRDAVGVFYSPSWLGWEEMVEEDACILERERKKRQKIKIGRKRQERKLSSDELVQFSDGWPLGNSRYSKQTKAYEANLSK